MEEERTMSMILYPKNILFPNLTNDLDMKMFEIGLVEGWSRLLVEGFKPILIYDRDSSGTEVVVRKLYSERDYIRASEKLDWYIDYVEKRQGITIETFWDEE